MKTPKGKPEDHTCHQPGGTCEHCPGCEHTRLVVTSKSASMPQIQVCTYCDGPELPGNIQRGPASAA